MPFVTSSTSDREATKIAEALFELFRDPVTAQVRNTLELADISILDDTACDRLAPGDRSHRYHLLHRPLVRIRMRLLFSPGFCSVVVAAVDAAHNG
jgi:hypothetical protein